MFRNLLLLALPLLLAAGHAHAQHTRFFPDSLGSHWICTGGGMHGTDPNWPNNTCDVPINGSFHICYWLDKDTMANGRRYQRVVSGYDFQSDTPYAYTRTEATTQRIVVIQ